MANQQRNLQFNIVTREQQTVAALKRVRAEMKKAGDTAEQTGTRARALGTGMSTWVAGLGLAAGGAFALSEAEEAQTTMARTAAVIKSTGNAAGVTADQQDRMVSSLSELAAVDDEVIAGGANMLRTFKDIKGEAFEPALAAALDLSAALGTDLQSEAIRVGKALQDPIRGITALTRAGIQFTEEQKSTIRSLVEQGDKLGAQRIILAELESQFGGSAEAMATDSARARVAIGNMAEEFGGVLAPGVEIAADAIGFFGDALGTLPAPMQAGVVGLAALTLASHRMDGGLGGLSGTLRTNVRDLSRLDTALAAATAGFAAYGTTTQFLEGRFGQFHGDLNDTAVALERLGSGTGDMDAVVEQFGGSIDELAAKFGKSSGDGLLGRLEAFGKGAGTFGNPLSGLFGDDGIAGVRQANADLAALEDQLKSLLDTKGPEEAGRAYGQLVNALTEAGVPLEIISMLLGGFVDELNEAKNAEDKGAEGARAHARAIAGVSSELEREIPLLERVANAAENAQSTFNAQVSLQDAQRSTADATEELADAQRSASRNSEEYRAATEAVTDAQEGVRDAQAEVLTSTQDLNEARAEAAERIEDMTQATRDAAQAQREARLALHEAEADARRVLADPGATALDKERAQVALAGAQNDIRSATAEHAEALREENEAKARGVEGDERVIDAKERVADANKRVQDAVESVGDAEARVRDVQRSSADRVREAQRSLEKAVLAEAEAWRGVGEAQLGPIGGLVAYRDHLGELEKKLDPKSPLRERVAALLAEINRAVTGYMQESALNAGGLSRGELFGSGGVSDSGGGRTPGAPQVGGTGQTGGSGGRRARLGDTVGAGSVVNFNSTTILQGTPTQTIRAQRAATRRELDRIRPR